MPDFTRLDRADDFLSHVAGWVRRNGVTPRAERLAGRALRHRRAEITRLEQSGQATRQQATAHLARRLPAGDRASRPALPVRTRARATR